jgi:hypothetical protein
MGDSQIIANFSTNIKRAAMAGRSQLPKGSTFLLYKISLVIAIHKTHVKLVINDTFSYKLRIVKCRRNHALLNVKRFSDIKS